MAEEAPSDGIVRGGFCVCILDLGVMTMRLMGGAVVESGVVGVLFGVGRSLRNLKLKFRVKSLDWRASPCSTSLKVGPLPHGICRRQNQLQYQLQHQLQHPRARAPAPHILKLLLRDSGSGLRRR